MKNELVLSTKDLNEVGINTQLTSNDLIEVVAQDIYDKYLDKVSEMEEKGKAIKLAYCNLFSSELNRMKLSLKDHLKKDSIAEIVNDSDFDEDDFEAGISMTFSKYENYWPAIGLNYLHIVEKDKGTYVDTTHTSLYIPSLKDKTAKVKLTISTGSKTEEKEITVNKISGIVETTVKKVFTQIITVPLTRFKELQKEVAAYNDEVKEIVTYLPKNRILSVEKFTREARVKIISHDTVWIITVDTIAIKGTTVQAQTKVDSSKIYYKKYVLYQSLFNQELNRLNRFKKPQITQRLLDYQDSAIKFKLLLEKYKSKLK